MQCGAADLDGSNGRIACGQNGVHEEYMSLCNVCWQLLIDQLLVHYMVPDSAQEAMSHHTIWQDCLWLEQVPRGAHAALQYLLAASHPRAPSPSHGLQPCMDRVNDVQAHGHKSADASRSNWQGWDTSAILCRIN